jgi:aspartate/methionine/tyrosine aminotransferase
LDAMERLKHYLSICNSGPSELLARIAVEATDAIFARNRALTAENLDRLDAFFARHEPLFEWYRPEGSCVAYPAYRGSDGVERFCEKLVETAGVLLLPGSMYRSELAKNPDGRFRIGYGRRNVPEALAAFDAYLEGTAR